MCRHIGLLFGKRLDTILLGHRIRKYPDSAVHRLPNPLQIYLFSTLVSGFENIWIRCRIRRMRVDGSRIRKENVTDSKISGYVWTESWLIFAPQWGKRCFLALSHLRIGANSDLCRNVGTVKFRVTRVLMLPCYPLSLKFEVYYYTLFTENNLA